MKKNRRIRFNNKVKVKYYYKNLPINHYYKFKNKLNIFKHNYKNKKNINYLIYFLIFILIFVIFT